MIHVLLVMTVRRTLTHKLTSRKAWATLRSVAMTCRRRRDRMGAVFMTSGYAGRRTARQGDEGGARWTLKKRQLSALARHAGCRDGSSRAGQQTSLARFKCPSVCLSDIGQTVGASALSQRGGSLRRPSESSSQRVAAIVLQVAVVLKATDDDARIDADL